MQPSEDKNSKRLIEVCSSPLLFGLDDHLDEIVVVIDILRATSSICIAFENGAEKIIPVAEIEETRSYREKGFLVAGERNGEVIEGFDFGNSPFSFDGAKVKGKSIAFTTTNGTQAIAVARHSKIVVIGSFLNLTVLCNWLATQNSNVVCLCAGWKNRFNLEDTLFAGAVTDRLMNAGFNTICDSAIAARHLYLVAKDDLNGFLEDSSHRRRLKRLHIERDIDFCLTPDQVNVIPVLKNGVLVKMPEDEMKSYGVKTVARNTAAAG